MTGSVENGQEEWHILTADNRLKDSHRTLSVPGLARMLAGSNQLFNPLFEQIERPVECRLSVGFGSEHLCRIRCTPMKLRRLAGKDGATFTSRLITHCDHKVERLGCKLIPGFAVRLAWIDTMPSQGFKRSRMHMPRWKASRAPGLESALSQIIQQSLGHDGTARVSRTEDEYFSGIIRHRSQHPPLRAAGFRLMNCTGASGAQQAPSVPAMFSEKNCASSMVR